MNAKDQQAAERAMTQDYWVQVVTNMSERAQLIASAPKHNRTKYTIAAMQYAEKRNYELLMDYIFQTRRNEVLSHAAKLQAELTAILES